MAYTTLLGWDFCFKLADETHLMIGGKAGSGKSTLLADFLYTLVGRDPHCQKLVLIDLKRVELIDWVDFPHTLKCVTEPEDVNDCLDWVIDEMESRYLEMAKKHQKLSDCCEIHVVIDETAEVMRVKGAEERIDQIMRLGRAARIHLVMATQNVARGKGGVPARIWQNVSCRVGLHCTTPIESRQIIGIKGCESLPRYGQCYINNADGIRLQSVPRTSEEMIKERLELFKNGVTFKQVG